MHLYTMYEELGEKVFAIIKSNDNFYLKEGKGDLASINTKINLPTDLLLRRGLPNPSLHLLKCMRSMPWPTFGAGDLQASARFDSS